MKRSLKSATLSVAMLLVCFALVEVVLRTTHLFGARLSWVEPDGMIGWRFTPGGEYWFFNENDHPITGRINAYGWRDVERDMTKRRGAYRVAVVGDSFVEAFQVEADSTFLALAERLLNTPGRPALEVMNFGRSGFTQTEESVVLWRDVFAFDPDAVVFVFVPSNDIADIDPRTTTNPERPFYRASRGELVLDTSFRDTRAFAVKERINWLKQHSALVSLVAERYNALRGARAAPPGSGDGSAAALMRHLTLWTSRPDSVYAQNLALCRRVIAMSADSCAARGVDFLLMGVSLSYTDEQIASCRRLDSTFDPGGMDRDLTLWALQDGYHYAGLQGPFRERYGKTGEELFWSHWNYAGHRVVARVLGDWIRERARARPAE